MREIGHRESDAILGAILKLNSSGAYTEILKTWGLESGAITDDDIPF